jgi:hypothetical protein
VSSGFPNVGPDLASGPGKGLMRLGRKVQPYKNSRAGERDMLSDS